MKSLLPAPLLLTLLAVPLLVASPAGAAPPPPGSPPANPAPAVAPVLASAGGAGAVRRYALIASANDGGPGRTRLRYADSDARAVAEVLRSLGGVSAQDLLLVPGATRASLERSFARIRETLDRTRQAGGPRREIFVYYSGHSDEEGLLLGSERVSYQDLRGWIEAAGAEVKIAILDSCASGALLRRKGGSMVPSFLDDVSTDARGHAFLTASSADEAAQESERIGAAFFTHYLVSGLRGAADTSRDGKVTLNEAYHFAYNETLRRTERTAAGPQHPRYDFQLTGKGDLPLTNLRATGAVLVLDEKLAGRVFVRDRQGRLLVELRKEPLYPVELGLGPGEYNVLVDADGRPFEAKVVLRDGQRGRVSSKELTPVSPLVAATRGDVAASIPSSSEGPVGAVAAGSSLAPPPGFYRHVPIDAVLVPGIRASTINDPVRNNFVLGVLGHSHVLQGLQLSLGGNIVEDRMTGAQVSIGFNLTRGPSTGVQIAAANLAMDRYRGVQIADVVNVSRGQFQGLQIAPGNWSSGDLRGAQLGVLNYSRGDTRGLQMGVVDVARGEVRGSQLSVVSMAGGITGLQLSVVNVGGKVKGTQIGVVNVASEVEGLQLGVLNVGRRVSGASVGVLSFIGDGYHRLSLWSSDVMPTNIGFKLGSKHVYTVLGGGIGRHDGNRALYGLHGGLGVHLTFGDRLFLDIDAITTSFASEDEWKEEAVFSSLRAVVGWQLMKHLAVTVGPTFNVNVRKKDATFRREGLGILESTQSAGNNEVRLFPGLVAGLQI